MIWLKGSLKAGIAMLLILQHTMQPIVVEISLMEKLDQLIDFYWFIQTMTLKACPTHLTQRISQKRKLFAGMESLLDDSEN